MSLKEIYDKAKREGKILSETKKSEGLVIKHDPLPKNIFIGIDCGVNTGVAVVEKGCFTQISTMDILDAHDTVLAYRLKAQEQGEEIHLVIEDPNLRTWYGSSSNEKRQGAGSIKRDFSIWVSFCKKYDISYEGISPKDVGSLFDREGTFKQYTGWIKRTSKHSRDAAKMVFRYVK